MGIKGHSPACVCAGQGDFVFEGSSADYKERMRDDDDAYPSMINAPTVDLGFILRISHSFSSLGSPGNSLVT